MPTISGLSSLVKIKDTINKTNASKVLLVTGKNSYESSGAKYIMDQCLTDLDVVHFFDFSVNPKIDDVYKGLDLLNGKKPDLMISVGGGSVMDMTKLLKASLGCTRADFPSVVQGKGGCVDPNIDHIAVPTTAGSGSEATHFAVCYIGKEKFSLAQSWLLPERVILDGKLLTSSSRYLRACNGLDALAQAIESYWATGSTAESRQFSFEAISILKKNINHFVNEINDETINQEMLLGAYYAGKAINISKTTAAHAWSYSFTSSHGIPHGHAVWLTLPAIFAIHAEKINPTHSSQMQDLIDLLELNNVDCYETKLKELLDCLNIEYRWDQLNLNNFEERIALSKQVNMERMSNNPIKLEQADINRIFR